MPSLAQGMEAGPGPDSLAYWLQPFKKYFERQGTLAREGLSQADRGAQQVRRGDLGGLAGMLMGPLGYLASPVNALLPTEGEVYNAPDLPEDAKPLVAGGLGLAAMMLPGNKKGMGRPPNTVYHGSPTLRNLADFDMNAPKRTDYGYLGDGMYVAPEEYLARGYAGHKGYIHPLEMPQGQFKDFPYVDETYQKSVNEFARSIGVTATEGSREWAREFSEKMQGLGYVGARGVNNDGSMAEAVIFDPKSAIGTPEGITAHHGSPQSIGERAKAAFGKPDETRALVAELESLSAGEVAEAAKAMGIKVASTKKQNIQQIGGASMQAARDADIAEQIRRGR